MAFSYSKATLVTHYNKRWGVHEERKDAQMPCACSAVSALKLFNQLNTFKNTAALIKPPYPQQSPQSLPEPLKSYTRQRLFLMVQLGNGACLHMAGEGNHHLLLLLLPPLVWAGPSPSVSPPPASVPPHLPPPPSSVFA